MSDKEVIEQWYKMISYLAAKDIPYLECTDGIYRPDFSVVAKDEKTLDKMNQSYTESFEMYIEVQKRFWGEKKSEQAKKQFTKKKHYEYD